MANDILDQMARNRIPSQITEKLFVGNFSASRNYDFISENKISHILTVANDIDPEYPSNCKYKIVDIDDWHEEDLSKHFQECFEFIDDGLRNGGGVLVHCLAGISRSPAIIIGYLMYADGISFDAAYNIVKSKRPIIGPNQGFLQQLTQLEHDLLQMRRINHNNNGVTSGNGGESATSAHASSSSPTATSSPSSSAASSSSPLPVDALVVLQQQQQQHVLLAPAIPAGATASSAQK